MPNQSSIVRALVFVSRELPDSADERQICWRNVEDGMEVKMRDERFALVVPIETVLSQGDGITLMAPRIELPADEIVIARDSSRDSASATR